MEANAAMKSIVRKDTGEDWREYVTRLMREEGAIEPGQEPSAEEVRRYVRWGASPRGLQTLVLAGRIRALLAGRYNVSLEDVELVAVSALRHRVFLNFEADAAGVDADQVVSTVLKAGGTGR